MKHRMLGIGAVLLLLFGALILAWRQPWADVGAKSQSVRVPAPEPVNTALPELKGTSPAQLTELWEDFEKPASPHSFDYRTSARLGQAIVTQVYQAQPGYFVLSTLTPRRESSGNASSQWVIHAETTRLGLDGSIERINAMDLTSPIGGGVSSNTLSTDGNHRLTISPYATDNPEEVGLRIEGLFRPQGVED
ncbi:MAG: hypothetical protein V4662_27425 [Verrucomicrobiota bacterium]